MASGSLTRGMEVNKVLDEGGAMPFPREDMDMMIYDRCPSPGVCHVPDSGPGAPTR
jgi:hypothetical protein